MVSSNVQKQFPSDFGYSVPENEKESLVRKKVEDAINKDPKLGALEKRMRMDDYDRYAKLLNKWLDTKLNQLTSGERPFTEKDQREVERLHNKLKPYL